MSNVFQVICHRKRRSKTQPKVIPTENDTLPCQTGVIRKWNPQVEIVLVMYPQNHPLEPKTGGPPMSPLEEEMPNLESVIFRAHVTFPGV